MRCAASDRYKWVALSNTTIGILMATINSSIVLIALPDIFRGINLNPLTPGNSSYLLWMIMGFLVATAVLVVSFGRVGDIYGRVRMFTLGFALFTVFSLLLSITWMDGTEAALWMIVMRIGQGVGGAFLFANSAAILTDAFPTDQRGLALGVNAVAGIAGSFIGLVVGGILGPIDWRLVFLVSVPVGLFGTFWSWWKLEERGIRQPARIDWWGNVTFAAGLILILVGITYGIQPCGHTIGWTDPKVFGSMIGGVLLLSVFAAIEVRIEDPMFRLSLFRIRAFTFGNIATLLASLGRGGLMFMLIMWLQGIWLPLHGYSFAQTPLWAGIYMLPLTVGFLVAGVRLAVRPLRRAAVRDRRHVDRRTVVLPARTAAGRLRLLGVRRAAAAGGHRYGAVRVAQPGRDHEQPARQPPRRRRRDGDDVPELGAGALDRRVLLADDPRPGGVAARHDAARAGRTGRGAAGRPSHLAAAAGRPAVRVVSRVQPDARAAGPVAAAPEQRPGGAPDRARVLPGADLQSFSDGLHEAFDFAIACCLVAAAASWFRGGRYVHGMEPAESRAVEAGDGELVLADSGD